MPPGPSVRPTASPSARELVKARARAEQPPLGRRRPTRGSMRTLPFGANEFALRDLLLQAGAISSNTPGENGYEGAR